MALRVDIGTLKPAKRLADGRVRAEAHITRAGVFEYLDEDGKVVSELRDDAEVFDGESMDSFAQVPVTNNHPPEKVTARNARQYMVGASGDRVQRDDDHLRTMLMFADEETLDEMQRDDKLEVSCGYTCDIVKESGVHPRYGRYDQRQTNIRGNHIAIVHRARAGATARVRFDDPRSVIEASRSIAMAHHKLGTELRVDSAAVVRSIITTTLDSAPPSRQDDVTRNPRSQKMPTPAKKPDKNDALTIQAAADQLAKAELRADTAEEKLEGQTKRADEAEGRAEALQSEIEQLKKTRLDESELKKRDDDIERLTKKLAKLQTRVDEAESPDRFTAGVRRRVKIITAAEAVLGEAFKSDTATDAEIMCAVVEKLQGTDIRKDGDGKERTVDYVTARFDAALEQWKSSEDAYDRLRDMTRGKTVEEPRNDSKSARDAYIDTQRNAWKKAAART